MTDVNARYVSDIALKKVHELNLYNIFCTKDEQEKYAKNNKNKTVKIEVPEEVASKENNDSSTDIKQVHWDDINIERTLGEGRFARVYLASIIGDGNNKKKLYGLKTIKKELIEETTDKRILSSISIDTIQEVNLLYKLGNNHPNIIHLYGIRNAQPAFPNPSFRSYGFFLLLDYLNGNILDNKLWNWYYKQKYNIQQLNKKILLEQQESLEEDTTPSSSSHHYFSFRGGHSSHHNGNGNHHSHHSSTNGSNSSHHSYFPDIVGTLRHLTFSSSHHHDEKGDDDDDEDEIIKEDDVKDTILPDTMELLHILLQIAKGMDYIHSKNIIFRDLKLENIGLVIDENNDESNSNTLGTVKIFDFGISKEIQYYPKKDEEAGDEEEGNEEEAKEKKRKNLLRRTFRKSKKIIRKSFAIRPTTPNSSKGNNEQQQLQEDINAASAAFDNENENDDEQEQQDDEQDDEQEEDNYNHRQLTKQTGTIRYMSPENLLGKSYSLPNDVYSFAMIFWEIFSFKRIYQSCTNEQIVELYTRGTSCSNSNSITTGNNNNDNDNKDDTTTKTTKTEKTTTTKESTIESKIIKDNIDINNCRPSLDNGDISYKITNNMKELIKECWNDKPTKRPTFFNICYKIKNEIDTNSNSNSNSSLSFYLHDNELKRQKEFYLNKYNSKYNNEDNDNDKNNGNNDDNDNKQKESTTTTNTTTSPPSSSSSHHSIFDIRYGWKKFYGTIEEHFYEITP